MRLYRLQDLTTIATGSQRVDQAVDIGAFRRVVVSVRKPAVGSVGTMYLQHSAVLEDNAFLDTGSTFSLTSATQETQAYTGLLRYVRWRAVTVTGNPQVVIDILGRQPTQLPVYFRMTELTTVSVATTQSQERWLDLGEYCTAEFQVRIAQAAATGTLYFQTAATLEDLAFANVGSIALTATGNSVVSIGTILRYVRWTIPTMSGTAQFQIDVIAREHY